MVRPAWLAVVLVMAAVPPCRAGGSDVPADPQAVAVNIQRTPAQPWPGYGIYLGDGIVVTAAHVAGHGLLTRPRVVVAGQPLDTATVKEGSFPDDDLTLLRVMSPLPSGLKDRRTTLCSDPPRPGDAVLVATPEKVTTSTIIFPEALPPSYRTSYASSIRDVYTTGNSGSGVFDANRRCLLGIMSSKLEQQVHLIVNGAPTVRTVGIAKHFVPAEDIRRFMQGLPPP